MEPDHKVQVLHDGQVAIIAPDGREITRPAEDVLVAEQAAQAPALAQEREV